MFIRFKPGGKLILRVHSDVLRRNNIKPISECPFIEKFNVKVFNGHGLEVGVISK